MTLARKVFPTPGLASVLLIVHHDPGVSRCDFDELPELAVARESAIRHTLITEFAESGAGDEVIMSIAGHVSRQMLARYSHIRMEAKRKALESIVNEQAPAPQAPRGPQSKRSAPTPRSRRSSRICGIIALASALNLSFLQRRTCTVPGALRQKTYGSVAGVRM